jgi:flagellar protein FlaI
MAFDYLASKISSVKGTSADKSSDKVEDKNASKINDAFASVSKDEFHQLTNESTQNFVDVSKVISLEGKIEVSSYGNVKIYKIPGVALKLYVVPVIKSTDAERKIITTLKEATTRLISIIPYKIRDPEERRNVYRHKVNEIIKNNPSLRIPASKSDFYAESVVKEMVGYGIIDDLVRDDKLEELMVIGPKKPVYVFHREHEMLLTNIEFISEQEIEDLINKIAREVERRVDVSSPLLDARLPDGSRVNATIPPASISGGTLTIRKFRKDPYSIIDLIKYGTLSVDAAAFLWMCVDGLGVKPANILISGGTGSGKTTLLNVLASFIPARERVITIEDTAELNLGLEHCIRFESKAPGIEGTGELKMDILTKNALRMRPDRIIVGEIRHEEAFTLFTAMNTGHDGCMGTIHANSPEETIVRVNSPPMNVPPIMLSGLDLIVVEHRYYDRRKGTIRRVSEIAEVYGALEGKARTQTIFQRDPVKDTLDKTFIESRYLRAIANYAGMSSEQVAAEINVRKSFLEEMVKNNVRSMSEFEMHSKKFIEDKKGMNAAEEK